MQQLQMIHLQEVMLYVRLDYMNSQEINKDMKNDWRVGLYF